MIRKLDPEKRQAFLDAALKLFAEHGVQSTNTAAISQEAGTAAGTLFLYFPTKQDLVNALILELGKAQSEYINSRLNPSLSVRDTFLTIWRGSIHWLLENPNAYRYVQQVRDSGVLPDSVVAESAHYFAYYYTAIQRGLQQGLIKPYPADLIGGFLYQDIVAVMNVVIGLEDAEREEVILNGFNIFWDGIRSVDK